MTGDPATIQAVCTEDVRVFARGWSAASVSKLCEIVERNDEAFDDVEMTIAPLPVNGGFAAAEWQVAMAHVGPLTFGDEVLDPSGLRIVVRGCTIAEFDNERICALRQYWDEISVLEQLGLIRNTLP
jgi:SnoaL-like polyketide cyclase